MRANHAVSLRSISAILYYIHGYQIKHFSNQDVEECAQCGSASRSGSEQFRRGSRTIAQRRGRAPLLYVRSIKAAQGQNVCLVWAIDDRPIFVTVERHFSRNCDANFWQVRLILAYYRYKRNQHAIAEILCCVLQG